MANSMWARLETFLKSCFMYFSPWLTGCEQHWQFFGRWSKSHNIFSHDQQGVSGITHFVKGSLITYFSMTNSEWVTLHILWKVVSESHLFLWPTASEWHYTFCERQSHHIFSYDHQLVSNITHSVKGSLITSLPMTNSMWVTLQILWQAVSSHLFLWPTASEWHCTFYERQSHHIFSYHQQYVSDVAQFVKCSLTSFPMTNSQWVT